MEDSINEILGYAENILSIIGTFAVGSAILPSKVADLVIKAQTGVGICKKLVGPLMSTWNAVRSVVDILGFNFWNAKNEDVNKK